MVLSSSTPAQYFPPVFKLWSLRSNWTSHHNANLKDLRTVAIILQWVSGLIWRLLSHLGSSLKSGLWISNQNTAQTTIDLYVSDHCMGMEIFSLYANRNRIRSNHLKLYLIITDILFYVIASFFILQLIRLCFPYVHTTENCLFPYMEHCQCKWITWGSFKDKILSHFCLQ